MSRKRRIFDIDVSDLSDMPVGKTPEKALNLGKRRGPMASAIAENAESLRGRRGVEDSIRAENDALAHEFVRLKKQGLIVDQIPLEDVVSEKLIRDRKEGPDAELQELKDSILAIGLSNPIRVEARPDGKFELVQGMRRLLAYRELWMESGLEAYGKIPAGIIAAGDSTEDMYRRMVDENLIRKGISFAEMAELARAYAQDPATDCTDADKAVTVLFGSAGYQKRSYIRGFVGLLNLLVGQAKFPEQIPRSLGLKLKKVLEESPEAVARLQSRLRDVPERTAEQELEILRKLAEGQGAENVPAGKVGSTPRKAKTTFQVARPEGVVKCSASAGRLELRFARDFSTVDRQQLERAVAAFMDALR